jgi:hypothetical protein
LEQTEPISTLNNQSCRENYFKKQTHFSKGNNVQDDPDSNIDVFLSRDTLFLHLSRIGLFGKK